MSIDRRFLVSLGFALASLATTIHAQRTWDGGGGGSSWTDTNNWNPDGSPVNQHIIFAATGTGTTTIVDANLNISHLHYTNTSGTHTTDLNGNTLILNNGVEFYTGRNTATSTAVIQNGTLNLSNNTNWRVGEREGSSVDAYGSLTLSNVALQSTDIQYILVARNWDGTNGSVTGVLDLSDATGTLNVRNGWTTAVGFGRDAHGTLTLGGSGMTTVIGQSAGALVDMRIGDSNGANNLDSLTTTGTLNGGSGSYTSRHSYLWIGHNEQNTGAAEGTLNLSSVAAGSSLTTYGWETRVGFGRQATGTLTLGPNTTASIGASDTQHATLNIGNSQGRNADGMTTTGTVASSGSFSGHLNWFFVGHNEQNTGAATGTLDLSAATGGTFRTYGWETRVGFGRDAEGTVDFNAPMVVQIGSPVGDPGGRAALYIGNSQGRNTGFQTTTGIVNANGASFAAHLSAFTVGSHDRNADDGGSATGTLDMSSASGGTFYTYGNQTQVGFGKNATGSVTFSDSQTVSIGQAGDRTYLRIGDSESRNWGTEATIGTMTSNGANFSAHLSEFHVGYNNVAGRGLATGTLDMSGASGGAFNTYGNQTAIGFGRLATGTVDFAAGQTVTIGQPTDRTWLRLGDTETRNAVGETTTGTINANGANFGANLSYFHVGYNNATTGSATATLDMSSASGGTFATYGGITAIGFGGRADGTVLMSANQTAQFGQSGDWTWLRIGDSETRNADGDLTTGTIGGAGTLNGNASHFWVGNNVHNAGAATGAFDFSNATGGTFNLVGGHEARVGFGRNAVGEVDFGDANLNIGVDAGNQYSWFRVGFNENQAGTLSQGTVTATGSVNAYIHHLWVGYNSNNAANTLDGTVDFAGPTTLYTGNEVRIGQGGNATGTLKLGAGAFTAASNVLVGDDDSGGNAGGSGTLWLRDTAMTQTGGSTTIDVSGTLKGHGSVTVNSLVLNGTVEGDGGLLDLSALSNITVGATAKWTAANGGSLLLPSRNVSPTDNWVWGGNAAAINSVAMSFSGVTGGTLSVRFLDPGAPALLPADTMADLIIGVWDFDSTGGFDFGNGSAALVFHYDESLLGTYAEIDLRLFHYDGNAWNDLGVLPDLGANTLSASGLTSFSPFAVGINIRIEVIPEPASFALLALAGLAGLRRRR